MPTKKKRAKLPSCTNYAIAKGTKFLIAGGKFGSLAKANLYVARHEGIIQDGERWVPVRVRVLPSAKRNRTRTR